MKGQSAAAVAVVVAGGVGVGVGAGAPLLLIVTLPPVPGETISSAPQLARASELTPRIRVRLRVFTARGPLTNSGLRFCALSEALAELTRGSR